MFAYLEILEPRRLFAVDLLTYRNDSLSTGLNNAETILTPATVGSGNFGKLPYFSATLDGQVYAQPLFKAGVNITSGAEPGVHNVLFVTTLHDSLYALDAFSGHVLWKDSFLNITNPTNPTPTTDVT